MHHMLKTRTLVSSTALLLFATTAITACGEKPNANAEANEHVSEPGKITVAPPKSDSNPDKDVAAQGAGLPPGYVAQLDKATAKITDASYTAAGSGRWEVHTGPAHILYSAKDTANGTYSLTATFEQLEKPAHPEAYGVFWGGTSLDNMNKQQYTYFVVRGDGKFLVKVRDGATTRTITDWTAHTGIPQQDAAGKGLYGIKVDVSPAGAQVSVNGIPVTTIPAKGNPMSGIAGVRINHNLHLMVTPASVTRKSAS